MARNYLQGLYTLKHPEKYIGTRQPRYLSSYELQVFRFLDTNPHIKKWGSETTVVKYYNPVKERKARYLVDIYVEYENASGERKTELIEIKPFKECQKPVKRGRKKASTFKQEQITYFTNQAKWAAAEQYAKERGWTFRVLTEKNIFL